MRVWNAERSYRKNFFFSGNERFVDLFLKAGADANARDTQPNQPALHLTSKIEILCYNSNYYQYTNKKTIADQAPDTG